MRSVENLYSDTPPSKLRDKEEPFIPADISNFWRFIFDKFFFKILNGTFSSIRVKNYKKFEQRDKECATIFYAPHSCWWDGIIAYVLCRNLFNLDMHLMVEELNRFPLLSKIGAFSVSKRTARSSLRSLKYSLEIIKNNNNGLWIYPQGIVRPPNYRPVKFMPGISYLCNHVNKVNLIPVAVKYEFLRDNKPEVLIEIGQPIFLNDHKERKEVNAFLESNFEELLDNQLFDISNGFLDDYEVLYRPPKSIYKRIETFVKQLR